MPTGEACWAGTVTCSWGQGGKEVVMAGRLSARAARWLRGGGLGASAASLPLGYLHPTEPLFASVLQLLVASVLLVALAAAWWGVARPAAWQRFVLLRVALRVPVGAALVGWAVIDLSPLFGRLVSHGPGLGLVLLLGGAVAYELGAAGGLQAAARDAGGAGRVPGRAGIRAAAAQEPGEVDTASDAGDGRSAAAGDGREVGIVSGAAAGQDTDTASGKGGWPDAAALSLVGALGAALVVGGGALLAGRAALLGWSGGGAPWAGALAAGCVTVGLALRSWRASAAADSAARHRGEAWWLWPAAALVTCALAGGALVMLVQAVLGGGAQVHAIGYVGFLVGWTLTLVGASAQLGCRWYLTRRRARRG